MRTPIKTVADILKGLEGVPLDTPVARMSQGYYHVIKQDLDMYLSPLGQDNRSETEKTQDDVPEGTLVLSFVIESLGLLC